MKKVDEGISIGIEFVHVYRDDIENIYNILADSFDQIELSIGNYELENLEEIDKIKDEKVEKLEIYSRNPRLTVHIDKWRALIMSSKSDNITYGLASKFNDILSKRQNKLRRVIEERYLYWFIGFLIVLGSIRVVDSYINMNSQVYNSLLGALVVIFLALIGYRFVGRDSVIELNYKKDAPSFFKRNRDQLIVELIVGIVLIIVGILIGLLIGQSQG